MNIPSPGADAVEALLLSAQKLIAENRLKEAANVFREVVARDPNNTAAFVGMAEISLQRGHLQTAWHLAAQAIRQQPIIANFLLAARIARAMGKLNEAVDCYTTVLQSFPENVPALMGIAEAYDAAGYRTRAIEYCEKAQKRAPHNLEFLRRIGKLYAYAETPRLLALYEQARPPETSSFDRKLTYQAQFITVKEYAERCAHGLPPSATSPEDLFFRFARRELDRLEELSDAALAETPEHRLALACKAVSLLARGNPKAAEPFFHARAQSKSGDLYDVTMFNEPFYRQLEAMEDTALLRGLPPLVTLTKPSFADEPVIFLSCDLKYFHKFARPLLSSIDAVAPGSQVHVHLMNATEEQLHQAASFCAALTKTTIGISAEDATHLTSTTLAARLYFHAIRFVRMFQHIVLYKRPLWLMDVDGLVNNDPRPVFRSFSDADITHIGHAGRLEPWSQFNASVFGVQPSQRGMNYLRMIAAYISYFHNKDQLIWGIDQLAMYGVFEYLRGSTAPPTVRMLPSHMLDSEYTPDSIMWTNGTAIKFSSVHALDNRVDGPPDSPRIRYLAALDKYTAAAETS